MRQCVVGEIDNFMAWAGGIGGRVAIFVVGCRSPNMLDRVATNVWRWTASLPDSNHLSGSRFGS